MQVLTCLFARNSHIIFIFSKVLLNAIVDKRQEISEVLFGLWKRVNFLESNSRLIVEILMKVSSRVVFNALSNINHSKVSMRGQDFSLHLSKFRPHEVFAKMV